MKIGLKTKWCDHCRAHVHNHITRADIRQPYAVASTLLHKSHPLFCVLQSLAPGFCTLPLHYPPSLPLPFPSPVLLSFSSTRGLLRNPSPSSHKFRTKWTQSLLILCNGPKITLCGFQNNVILVTLFISLDRYILSKYFIEKCTFVIIELSVSVEAKSLK